MCQSVNVASLTSVVKVQLKSVEALFSLIPFKYCYIITMIRNGWFVFLESLFIPQGFLLNFYEVTTSEIVLWGI